MFKQILIFLVLLTILIGCGFKGPLYLPSKDANPEPTKNQKSDTVKSTASAPDRYKELQNEQE